MSVSTEVQRTLVKSPPELWAELSDPAALARQLSELGDIRITRTQPEQVVEWEATAPDGTKASGKVEISASGWGTKVTFSATRADAAPPVAPPPAPAIREVEVVDPDPGRDPGPGPGPVPELEPKPFAGIDALREEHPPADDDPLDDPVDDDPLDDDLDLGDDDDLGDEDGVLVRADPSVAPESSRPDPPITQPSQPKLEPRRGFFARLLGLRLRPSEPEQRIDDAQPPAVRDREPQIASPLPPPELPSAVAIAEQATQSYEAVGAKPPVGSWPAEPLAPEFTERDAATLAAVHAAEAQGSLAPTAPTETGEAQGIAAELRAAEEAAGDQVTAVLTSALDRLGAAHHRPFSRA